MGLSCGFDGSLVCVLLLGGFGVVSTLNDNPCWISCVGITPHFLSSIVMFLRYVNRRLMVLCRAWQIRWQGHLVMSGVSSEGFFMLCSDMSTASVMIDTGSKQQIDRKLMVLEIHVFFFRYVALVVVVILRYRANAVSSSSMVVSHSCLFFLSVTGTTRGDLMKSKCT